MNNPSDIVAVENALSTFIKRYEAMDIDGILKCFSSNSEGFYVGSGEGERANSLSDIKTMFERDFQDIVSIKCDFKEKWIKLSPKKDSACCYLRGVIKVTFQNGTSITPVPRKTIYMEKVDGEWLQVHSHMSFPSCDQEGEGAFPSSNLREKYGFFFSKTSEMVFFIRADDMTIEDVNKSASDTLGCEVDVLKNIEYTSLFDDITSIFLSQAIDEGKTDIATEGELIKADGDYIKVYMSMDYFSVAGEGFFLSVVRDISDRKKQNEILRHRLVFEELISDISSKVFLNSNLDETLYECVERLGLFVGAEACYIFTFSEDCSSRSMTHLWERNPGIYSIDNFQELPSNKYRYFLSKMRKGDIVIVDNPHNLDDRWEEEKNLLLAQPFLNSFVAVPFFISGLLSGYIGFDNMWESQSFSEDDLALLSTFSEVLGQSMAKIKSDLKLKQVMEGTIEALSRVVELKDLYTGNHQKRVSLIATAIAEKLGASKDEVDGIKIASLIHDLGKIQIPSEILSKPGSLSTLEYRLVQSHPEAGYEVLKNVKFPWPIAEAVLQHHERLDGSGYPYGIKGDDIIFEARVISVADVIEAMISHRPYRPGLGIDRAIEEIISGRSVKYDESVVDACIELYEGGFFESLLSRE